MYTRPASKPATKAPVGRRLEFSKLKHGLGVKVVRHIARFAEGDLSYLHNFVQRANSCYRDKETGKLRLLNNLENMRLLVDRDTYYGVVNFGKISYAFNATLV